jgi:hypothetical protein
MTPDQRQKLIELAQLGDADSLHAALRMRRALVEASDQIHLGSFRLFGEYLRTIRKAYLNASYDGLDRWIALDFMKPRHFSSVDSVDDKDFTYQRVLRPDIPDGFYRVRLVRYSSPSMTKSVDTRELAQQMGFNLD